MQHPHRAAVGHPESNKLDWTHCCSAVHSDLTGAAPKRGFISSLNGGLVSMFSAKR